MNEILNYIGFSLSIIGALPTILWIFYRKRKLLLFHEGSFQIRKDLVHNPKDLSIQLKGRQIDGNFQILHFSLFNSSRMDIGSEITHSPPKIYFTPEMKIIESNIIKSPENSNISLEHDTGSCVLKWDLLKRNEFIEVEILGEMVDTEPPVPPISKIEHRITGLDEIETKSDRHLTDSLEDLLPKYITYALQVAFFGITIIPMNYVYKTASVTQTTSYATDIDNVEHEIYFHPSKVANSVEIQLDRKETRETITWDEFNNNYKYFRQEIVSNSLTLIILYALITILLSHALYSITIELISGIRILYYKHHGIKPKNFA